MVSPNLISPVKLSKTIEASLVASLFRKDIGAHSASIVMNDKVLLVSLVASVGRFSSSMLEGSSPDQHERQFYYGTNKMMMFLSMSLLMSAWHLSKVFRGLIDQPCRTTPFLTKLGLRRQTVLYCWTYKLLNYSVAYQCLLREFPYPWPQSRGLDKLTPLVVISPDARSFYLASSSGIRGWCRTTRMTGTLAHVSEP